MNKVCCDSCYCFVCEQPAANCQQWVDKEDPHCNARDMQSWRAKRAIKRAGLYDLFDEIRKKKLCHTSQLTTYVSEVTNFVQSMKDTFQGFHLDDDNGSESDCECMCHVVIFSFRDLSSCSRCLGRHKVECLQSLYDKVLNWKFSWARNLDSVLNGSDGCDVSTFCGAMLAVFCICDALAPETWRRQSDSKLLLERNRSSFVGIGSRLDKYLISILFNSHFPDLHPAIEAYVSTLIARTKEDELFKLTRIFLDHKWDYTPLREILDANQAPSWKGELPEPIALLKRRVEWLQANGKISEATNLCYVTELEVPLSLLLRQQKKYRESMDVLFNFFKTHYQVMERQSSNANTHTLSSSCCCEFCNELVGSSKTREVMTLHYTGWEHIVDVFYIHLLISAAKGDSLPGCFTIMEVEKYRQNNLGLVELESRRNPARSLAGKITTARKQAMEVVEKCPTVYELISHYDTLVRPNAGKSTHFMIELLMLVRCAGNVSLCKGDQGNGCDSYLLRIDTLLFEKVREKDFMSAYTMLYYYKTAGVLAYEKWFPCFVEKIMPNIPRSAATEIWQGLLECQDPKNRDLLSNLIVLGQQLLLQQDEKNASVVANRAQEIFMESQCSKETTLRLLKFVKQVGTVRNNKNCKLFAEVLQLMETPCEESDITATKTKFS